VGLSVRAVAPCSATPARSGSSTRAPSYFAGTPFAYIGYHHVSPQLYGVLFALGIVGTMATN
jgi:hypothetical protein